MADLKNPRLMWLKAWLLLAIGVIASVLVVLEAPSLRVGAMLALAIWAFCRVYYFCFYVIEKYVDPSFRFAGLWSVVRHVRGRRPDARDDA